MTETTYIYARVSTPDQSLDGQKQDCWEYCTDDLGIAPRNIHVIEDESTGMDTEREGYQELMDIADEGEIDRVVVKEVSRIARNMQDLNRGVGHLCDDNDVALHILESGLQINENDDEEGLFDDRLILQVLGIASELEAKLIRKRTKAGLAAAKRAGKWTGRPPYGFDSVDGYLVPNESYDTAIAIIDRIEGGESIRSTARHADVSRSTVRNVVERKELYLGESESDPVIKDPEETEPPSADPDEFEF